MSEAIPRDRAPLLRPTDPAARRPLPPSADASRIRRPRRLVRPLLFLLLPLALVAGGAEYVLGGRIMSTENAYVRADIVAVSTDISGIVKDIAVHENQAVKPGDVLFRLDDLPYRLALDKAQAQLGIVAATLNALKASYRDMQAQLQQSQFDVDYYAREQDRQQRLLVGNVASVVTFEQAQRNLMSARHRLLSQQQQLAGIAANLGGDPDIAIEKHPRSLEAVAARDEAARQLDHTTVRAPIAGIVTNVPSLQPGQYLMSATAALSVVATDHLWIDANPKETELTWVRPGQDVGITVDTYPGQTWHGVVDSISPASAASFAMLPAQNTSGNWVKVVQRIQMRVRLDTRQDQDATTRPVLRAGMSVTIDVDTGRARGWPAFLAPIAGPSHG